MHGAPKAGSATEPREAEALDTTTFFSVNLRDDEMVDVEELADLLHRQVRLHAAVHELVDRPGLRMGAARERTPQDRVRKRRHNMQGRAAQHARKGRATCEEGPHNMRGRAAQHARKGESTLHKSRSRRRPQEACSTLCRTRQSPTKARVRRTCSMEKTRGRAKDWLPG